MKRAIKSSVTSQRTTSGFRLPETLEDRTLFSTYMVTTLSDSGVGSLRQAVVSANAHAGTDAIAFKAGLHGTIVLTSGQLSLTGSVAIAGPGASLLSVSGDNLSRVFSVGAGVSATINGLTITKGNPGLNYGGGVLNHGTLTLNSDIVTGNVSASLAVGGVYGGGAGLANFGTASITGSTFKTNAVYAHDASNHDGGGAIYNAGTLTLVASSVSSNTVQNSPSVTTASKFGGGIFNSGTATIVTTSITNNTVFGDSGSEALDGGGGGLFNSGHLTMSRDTVSGNIIGFNEGFDSTVVGGGIDNTGTATITNSTIYANVTDSDYESVNGAGGGISTAGSMTLVNCTIAGNYSATGGGGIEVDAGTLKIGNTIVANNADGIFSTSPLFPDQTDFSSETPMLAPGGKTTSLGHNLIGDDVKDTFWSTTDIVGTTAHPVNPKLGGLAFNGGATETLAIGTSSPAYNKGSNAIVTTYGLTSDQRGDARVDHGTVDIGAYEE